MNRRRSKSVKGLMPMPSQLPFWLQYVQALGPTTVAVVVGAVAAYIAWRQWRTANDRLRFDLFEKRAAVYEAIGHLIGNVALHGHITADDLGSTTRELVALNFSLMATRELSSQRLATQPSKRKWPALNGNAKARTQATS
jgi:hypothetical protein